MAERVTSDEIALSVGRMVESAYNRLLDMERWSGPTTNPNCAPYVNCEFISTTGARFNICVTRMAENTK